jgi:hypothetical protein
VPEKCPGRCCESGDLDCNKRLDATGFPIIADDEFLLIFGGMSWRNKTFNYTDGKNYSIFDQCEQYVDKMNDLELEIPDTLKSCGETLLNDLWKYSLRRKKWYPIKLDNMDRSKFVKP